MKQKIPQYIVSRKCVYHLWILGIVWLIIGVLPAMIGAVVYPPGPVEGLPADIVPEFPYTGWEFWVHRVSVDPLTKSIGAVPVVILIVFLIPRTFLTNNKVADE